MNKTTIHTLVISEKLDWREVFYLKIDRQGNLRIRSSLPVYESPAQVVLEKQEQLFHQLIEMMDAQLLMNNGIYQQVSEPLENRELTLVLSNQDHILYNSQCYHFQGAADQLRRTNFKKEFQLCERLMEKAKKLTSFWIDDARLWNQEGIRPTRFPEGTPIQITSSQRNEYEEYLKFGNTRRSDPSKLISQRLNRKNK